MQNSGKHHNSSALRVLVLFGPTASGKTNVLMRLFSTTGKNSQRAEVVSADSMQVYRGMDIGTAKPSAEERAIRPHHLLKIRNPNEQFNAGNFVRLASEAVDDIVKHGAIPVISGGSGFYLKNFIFGLPEAPPSDEAVRSKLKHELLEKGAAALMEELTRFDPPSAGKIHINDEYRLLRALEVLRVSGKPLSSFKASTEPFAASQEEPILGSRLNSRYDFCIIGLSRPREELYRRIDARCASMFLQDLPGEVRGLYEAGYSPHDPGLRAIGYKEFFVEEPGTGGFHLSQDITGVQALVAQNSRLYAKRQLTFFANLPGVKWVETAGNDEETAQRVFKAFNQTYNGC
jgi:tRNA dimethylallyltransferase